MNEQENNKITLMREGEYPKQIDTLVDDIYSLFQKPHQPSEENLESFAEQLKVLLRSRMQEDPSKERPAYLRMSGIGKPDRQLWYQMRLEHDPNKVKPACGRTHLNFLFGDLVELLILFLAREAGHTVENEQKTVNIDGLEGHLDCTIDGVVLDVKSASSYGMSKFKGDNLLKDDPFGYLGQISSYKQAIEAQVGHKVRQGFLAFCKNDAEVVTCMVGEKDTIDIKQRLVHVENTLKKDTPPPRCYAPKKNDNGNEELAKGCVWCPFKEVCWSDSNGGQGLRVFKYSNGNTFLTKVVKAPKVEEITRKYFSLKEDLDSVSTEI